MIFDLNSFNKSDKYNYDAIIIGSGAAGISLGLNLAKRRLRTLILEGGELDYTDWSQDHYYGTVTARDLPYGLKDSRQRYFGGSTNCWAGGCGRLDAIDFLERDWIEKSGWPIDIEQMERWYGEAEKFLNISSENSFDDLGELLGFETKGLTYTEKVNFAEHYFQKIYDSKFLDLIFDANFKRFNLDDNGNSVTNVEVVSKSGVSKKFASKIYTLAAGGIETTKILLNSKKYRRVEIGNSSSTLGKFFCDHPIAPVASLIDSSGFMDDYKYNIWKYFERTDPNVRIPFFKLTDELQITHKLLNGAVQFYEQELELDPELEAAWKIRNSILNGNFTNISIEEIMSVTSSLQKVIRAYRQRRKREGRIALRFQIEQEPRSTNQIALIDETDSSGLNKVNLHWDFGDSERRTIEYLVAATTKALHPFGVTLMIDKQLINSNDLPFDLRGGQHHCGTTRMSKSASSGVVDRNLKVWDMKNLYICSSSVFPTNGWVNPTLTIIALAQRLGKIISDEVTI